MKLDDKTMLKRLGAGEPIGAVCSDAGMSRAEFDDWWRGQLESRLPDLETGRAFDGAGRVDVLRDETGTPHIYADTGGDLFFGYGFAMGQDRLWQLDYLRRKALGRLAEVLGPDGLETDIIARTVGIHRIAAEEIDRIPAETRELLEAFSDGINAAMEEGRSRLPIEFDLLDYEPEPWSPVDSIAIWAEFRWYLTGRLPVIALPEMARRALGDGPLYQAFLLGEAEDESIVPHGHYPPNRSGGDRVGEVVSDPDEGLGSNNWVIGGALSDSGLPILASDPHIAFGSVSCWYQAHLSGAGFNTVGAGYAGVPGIIFGRNERTAWGLTNNICAQRDLYQEKEHPDRPGHFLYDGEWERASEVVERIEVKGADPVTRTIRSTRNGPLADEIVPGIARDSGPVSLRWMGHEPCDEITSMLAVNRADSAAEIREALRTWIVPTWSFGFADVDGHFGYQSVGRIPIKESWGRGYRPGWDPDPPVARVHPLRRHAEDGGPRPGVGALGEQPARARGLPLPAVGRVEQRPSRPPHSHHDRGEGPADPRGRGRDADGLHVAQGAGGPARAAADAGEGRRRQDRPGRRPPEGVGLHDGAGPGGRGDIRELLSLLGSAGCSRAVRARPGLGAGHGDGGLSLSLLDGDEHGWFDGGDREGAIVEAMTTALDDLESRLGSDMSAWTWGAVHTVRLDHHLTSRAEIFETLNRGGDPVRGSGITVCNTGFDPTYLAAVGANYRINAELSDDPPGLWAVDTAGLSGNPGSANYCDQLSTWLAGKHYYLPLDRERVEERVETRLTINGE